MQSTDIKNKIKALLDGLVTSEVLGEVQMDDFKKSVLDRDYANYPAAVLTGPATTSEYLTNRDNIRTYTFEIIVLQNAENVSSSTEIEELVEAILNVFDNDPTLTGSANGAVEPSASSPAPAMSRGKTFIGFVISLKARAIINLNF